MQKLKERRLTNTPADIPQVCSNCGLSLNSPERVRDSVAGLKTSLNNPDAVITMKLTRAGNDAGMKKKGGHSASGRVGLL